MVGLLVDSINRHLRTAKQAWIVERPDLNNNGGKSLRQGRDVSAAFSAKLARDRPFEISSRELLRRTLSVLESGFRHRDEDVRRSASDVLAFAAMALGFHHRVSLGDVAQRFTIATAFEFHGVLPLGPVNVISRSGPGSQEASASSCQDTTGQIIMTSSVACPSRGYLP